MHLAVTMSPAPLPFSRFGAMGNKGTGGCRGTFRGMAAHTPLEFPHQAYAEMIAHAYAGYPLEACGLLVGSGSTVHRFVPCTNEAASETAASEQTTTENTNDEG